MKNGIHPDTKPVKAKCICGNEFDTMSVRSGINVEICAACHPFFTGQKRVVDTAGRVERFMSRAGRAGVTYGQKKPKSGDKS
jgi:large subunit ribosomal protein L31